MDDDDVVHDDEDEDDDDDDDDQHPSYILNISQWHAHISHVFFLLNLSKWVIIVGIQTYVWNFVHNTADFLFSMLDYIVDQSVHI